LPRHASRHFSQPFHIAGWPLTPLPHYWLFLPSLREPRRRHRAAEPQLSRQRCHVK